MILVNILLLAIVGTLFALFTKVAYRAAVTVGGSPDGGDHSAWEAGVAIGAMFFFLPGMLILALTGQFDKPVFKGLFGLVDISLRHHLAAVLMFASLVGAVYGSLLLIRRLPGPAPRMRKYEHLMGFFLAALAAYVITLILDISVSGVLSGDSHWYRARHDAMSVEHGSIFTVILIYFKNAARLIYFSALFAIWRGKRIALLPFLILWMLSMAVDVYLSGNRFIIAATAFVFLFYLVADGKWKAVAATVLSAIPIAWFGTLFMIARGSMHSRDTSQSLIAFFAEVSSGSATTSLEYFSNAFEGINFNVFVSVFYDTPDRISFLYGQSFIKALVFWIPRSFWEDKMLRPGQVLGDYYAGASGGLSLVATLPGETWLNFGYLSLLAVPVLLYIAYRVFTTAFASLPALMRFPLIFMFAFSMCRASYAALMIDSLINCILIMGVVLVVQRRIEFLGRRVTR